MKKNSQVDRPETSSLNEYVAACAESGGVPLNPESFLPWNLSKERLAEFQRAGEDQDTDTS